MPDRPGNRWLAIATGDHPLEYLGFAGTIHEGQYGAGTVSIADRGTYSPVLWTSDRIQVVISGANLMGTCLIVPFARAGNGQWLIRKKQDMADP